MRSGGDLAPAAKRLKSIIHWINHYPLIMQLILIPLIRGIVIYPVDSAIPPFKNSGLLFLLPEGGGVYFLQWPIWEESVLKNDSFPIPFHILRLVKPLPFHIPEA